MKIAKEGFIFISIFAILSVILFGLKFTISGAISLIIALFMCCFFRDPKRIIPTDPKAVLSPADGTITDIKETTFEGKPYHQIVIFCKIIC